LLSPPSRTRVPQLPAGDRAQCPQGLRRPTDHGQITPPRDTRRTLDREWLRLAINGDSARFGGQFERSAPWRRAQ
jgi:hypothetical protein